MPSTTTHGLVKPIGADTTSEFRIAIGANADTLDSYLLSTVTSLPGSPVDGQRCLYLADATNGVVWDLRYRSASGSTYKWEFLGGSSLAAEITTAQGIGFTSGAYADLATAGPSITVPLAGDYDFTFGAEVFLQVTGLTGTPIGLVAPKFGSATAVDTDRVAFAVQVAEGSNIGDNARARVERTIRRNVSAAATAVKLQYQANNTTNNCLFEYRCIAARPVRVG